MIGNRFYLPQDLALYKECALWCNRTQQGRLVNRGEYYECVACMPEARSIDMSLKLRTAVTEYINSVARSRDYDNVEACVSYRYSDNATWRDEAEQMASFRDSVWSRYYEIKDTVTSVDELMNEMPTIIW